MERAARAPAGRRPVKSANDRLKSRWNAGLIASLLTATAAHAAVFALLPGLSVPDWSSVRDQPGELITLERIAQVELPVPAGERIALPELASAFVASEVEYGFDVEFPEMPEVTMPDRQPPAAIVPVLERPTTRFVDFAPSMARPQIRNLAEAEQFMVEHYYPLNEVTGAAGEVFLSLSIDERGAIHHASVGTSSGDARLDALALRFTEVVRFRPAYLGGRPVAVNVTLPLLFEVRS